jgi:AcrR family transcriptional regulator
VADTRSAIQQAAIDLFHRQGYFATSISDIAQACGIRKSGLYYWFASKEELLFSILETTMTDLMACLRHTLTGIENVEDRMRAAVCSHVGFHLRRQKENFIANSELRGLSAAHYRAIVALRDAYEQAFQELIRQGHEAGIFAPCDVKILSYAILALCTSGAFWFNPAGRLSVEQIAAIYEGFVLSGLKGSDPTLAELAAARRPPAASAPPAARPKGGSA